MEIYDINSKISITNLKINNRVNPIGLDDMVPRFSWQLICNERNQKQLAYEILVASEINILQQDRGDIWESGKVGSDESNNIGYSGIQLKSQNNYYWKVRIWDKFHRVSCWSDIATWSMGILSQDEWKGKWIGGTLNNIFDDKYINLDDCNVIWNWDNDTSKNENLIFQYSFDAPNIDDIKWARLIFHTCGECYVYFNNNKPLMTRSHKTYLISVDIKELLIEGLNNVYMYVRQSKEKKELVGKIFIGTASGEVLTYTTNKDWKCDKQIVDYQTEMEPQNFNYKAWGNVKVLGVFNEQDKVERCIVKKLNYNEINLEVPYFRKDFEIFKNIKKVTVYSTALGIYELHLNNKKVNEEYFAPGYTDYTKRVQYQTYDITNMVNKGNNVIGAVLGKGWYAGNVGIVGENYYGENPFLLIQMKIEYEDGTYELIVSDETWKTNYGPILYSDLIMGEIYDATKELENWSSAEFFEHDWKSPTIKEKYEGKLVSQIDPPIRITEILQAISVKKSKKGYIFDFGQNLVGWAELKINEAKGTKIQLNFAEMVWKNGELYTINLRNAKQREIYIAKGEKDETFEPHFTIHGFRYAEIIGLTEKPSLECLTAKSVYSDTPKVGEFKTSDELINKLQSNITWGQRDNFVSIPTDCPQRDERLGWTADAQIFARTASFNMDVWNFFSKYMLDVEDAQHEDGAFTDVAPDNPIFGSGTAAWADAGVILPWIIYQVYGDKSTIKRHYKSMQKWIDYCIDNSDNLLRPAEGYGEWLSVGADTPKDLVATAYFAYSTALISKMAKVIENHEDSSRYNLLFNKIKMRFINTFVDKNGVIVGDTQAAYVLALKMDLLTDELIPIAVERLIRDIENKDWHLTTGFLGVSYLLPMLCEHGHEDVAYRLLHQDTYPSWLYSIHQGATTIWERWDGWTAESHGASTSWYDYRPAWKTDGGFGDPHMNSFNHYSLGSVGEWFYRYVAGIDLYDEEPGYKKIKINPRIGGKLTNARGEFNSNYGKIVSSWEIKDNIFKLHVEIPVNTTAYVYINSKDLESITESNIPIAKVNDIRFVNESKGKYIFETGSGKYDFQCYI